MPIPVFAVGQVAQAADVNTWMVPLAAVKTSDTSRASTTTLTADPELTVAIPSAGTWYLLCYLDFEGATSGAGGLTIQFSSVGTLRYTIVNETFLGSADVGSTFSGGGTITIFTNGAGVLQGATIHGALVTTVSGTITLNWAQVSSNATATIMHAQSAMMLWRIS